MDYVRIILIGIAFLVFAIACEPVEKEMKVPYQESAASCYKRLKETNPVFQKGIEQIRATVESGSAFSKRLEDTLSIHESIIEQSRSLKSDKPWIEEDVYLCCFFDLLEALFGLEAESILKDLGTAEEKKNRISNLIETLDKVPLSGPKWNRGVQVSIRKNLEAARNVL